jgi:DNA-directed RNA polymerase sigma subunit (sigma70/sigma32)
MKKQIEEHLRELKPVEEEIVRTKYLHKNQTHQTQAKCGTLF